MSDSSSFPLRWRGRQTEPLALAEIQRRLDRHEIGMWHEIQVSGRWLTLEEFYGQSASPGAAASARVNEAFSGALRIAGSEAGSQGALGEARRLDSLPAPPPAPTGTSMGRPRWAYALLAFLTGMFGLHNFFAGYWWRGLAQAALCVATFWFGYGIVAAWLWAMADAIWIKRDARGIPLR
jgi:hypothetical protein